MRDRTPPEPTTMAALLAERGFVACWCGAARKRTTGPWGCGRRGCVDNHRDRRSASDTGSHDPVQGGSRPPVPATSKPMPGRHARGDAVCDALMAQIVALGNITVTREWRFAPPRRWRFDLAVVLPRLAIEVDGGSFTGGHSRGAAYAKECEKFNEATLLGWRVLRVTPGMVKDGTALALVRRAVGGEDGRG